MDIAYEGAVKQCAGIYDALQRTYASSYYRDGKYLDESDCYQYVLIKEIRLDAQTYSIKELLHRVLTGLYSIELPVSLLVKGNVEETQIYIGTEAGAVSVLLGNINALIPGIKCDTGCEIRSTPIDHIFDKEIVKGGLLKGVPHIFSGEDKPYSLLDNMISGMRGRKYFYRVDAFPVARDEILESLQSWSNLKDRAEVVAKQQVTYPSNSKSISYEVNNYKACKCAEIAESCCERFSRMLAVGGWTTSVRYGSGSNASAEMLAGILVSSLSDIETKTEPIHIIQTNENGVIHYDGQVLHQKKGISESLRLEMPRFCNMYSSEELAQCISMPEKDYFGFSIRDFVPFEVSGRNIGNVSLGNIIYNSSPTMQEYKIDINEFNRHCLVSGLTGGGKTNTIKSLLCNIKASVVNIKMLLIEPAKREYWQLYNLGFEDLCIFSIGGTQDSYRVNIFEKIGNIPIQTHIDYVLASFKACFIMYTPMPYVLERAVYEIYEDCGWNIAENHSKYGNIYPTIENLYYKIPIVVEKMGYEAKIQQDLIGSLQARVNSMRIGAKGRTLNTRKSFPIERILETNTIVELEDIADDEIKAFIMSIILVQVMEYRLQQEDSQKELRHILLIEEAHRLLKNVHSGTGENADPRGNAVEFFCNMLAELRSKGQGFIIADQIPSKLAPDIVKNTNIKITHRIVDGEERNLIGNSMHMTEKQIEALSSLTQGCAAVYAEGDERPKLIKAKYANDFSTKKYMMNRNEILNNCHVEFQNDSINLMKLSEVCSRCRSVCAGSRSQSIKTKNICSMIEQMKDTMKGGLQFEKSDFDNLVRYLSAEGINVEEEPEVLNCFVKELVDSVSCMQMQKSVFINDYYSYIDREETV